MRYSILIALALIPCSLLSQDLDQAMEPQTYGTQSLTWLTLNAWDFVPLDSSVTYGWSVDPAYGIFRTNQTGETYMQAGVHLPAGALISVIQLNACDTAVGGAVLSFLNRVNGAGLVFAITGPTTVGTPGCVTVERAVNPPLIVENAWSSYVLSIRFSANGSSLILISARIGYRLQVSPAPNTATFSDVPTTHPFFRFIEALAASGITAGCSTSPPQFCPDSPLTRGQMAVFLSAALGLHFAP